MNRNSVTFRVGDKVRFLNEVGGGYVKRIRNDGLVLVENDDGFDYPVHPKELVLIESTRTESDRNKNAAAEKSDNKTSRADKVAKVIVAFTRNKSENAVVLHLINDTENVLHFAIYSKDKQANFNLISEDKLEPDTKIEIAELLNNELDDINNLYVQGFFSSAMMSELLPGFIKNISYKPIQLLMKERYLNNIYFNQPACLSEVYNSSQELTKEKIQEILSEKASLEKEAIEKAQKSKKHPEPVVWEEDLHINVLVESVVGMSNTEILNFQMTHFRKILDNAIVQKVDNVIFIHGIGNGTLKMSLRKALQEEYELYFEDASFKEYGFGATKVFSLRKSQR
jgi:hypothetical protein